MLEYNLALIGPRPIFYDPLRCLVYKTLNKNLVEHSLMYGGLLAVALLALNINMTFESRLVTPTLYKLTGGQYGLGVSLRGWPKYYLEHT